MTANGWFQILLFLALVFLVTKPMGVFMTRVFNREKTFMDPVLRPIERLLFWKRERLCRRPVHWSAQIPSLSSCISGQDSLCPTRGRILV